MFTFIILWWNLWPSSVDSNESTLTKSLARQLPPPCNSQSKLCILQVRHSQAKGKVMAPVLTTGGMGDLAKAPPSECCESADWVCPDNSSPMWAEQPQINPQERQSDGGGRHRQEQPPGLFPLVLTQFLSINTPVGCLFLPSYRCAYHIREGQLSEHGSTLISGPSS